MALPIREVVGILADNLDKRGGVIPLSRRQATGWARGLDMPFGGETVIYTGQMYQLIPAINSLANLMARFENSRITRFFGLGRMANRFINLSWFMKLGAGREQQEYDNILRNIALLLKAAGLRFGYLYAKELYSGALVYDAGIDDVFVKHARLVYRTFKENGVKRVITVDPHTTNMLKTVYPAVIEGYDLKCKSYLEVLAEQNMPCPNPLNMDLVIHDSCVYARHESIVEQPRSLLLSAGATIHEPGLSAGLTHCCGGPLESLFPSRSHEIAGKRVEQLAECGRNITTMCPICMASLKRAANNSLEIKDISEHLARSYNLSNP